MNVTFRCDSSINIGIGHVMRCITLANALRIQGVRCSFICRIHEGSIISLIKKHGFIVYELTSNSTSHRPYSTSGHLSWLGISQKQDAKECIFILNQIKPDWLIIDHYALDATWEKTLRPYCKKIMVLDDLADRVHDCDLLLDQSIGRQKSDYRHYLPLKTKLLLAPKYLLIRTPFLDAALKSKESRPRSTIQNIFISMGGMDNHNYISQILLALVDLHKELSINVNIIISSLAPHINEIYSLQKKLPFHINIHDDCDAVDMANFMLKADIAISASGFTSYELVCMHVPTLLIPLSDIQYKVAKELVKFTPVHILDFKTKNIENEIRRKVFNIVKLTEFYKDIRNQSHEGFYIDGKGLQRVIQYLMDDK